MNQIDLISQIRAKALGAEKFLIGIDGMVGAGKSTLASNLAQELGAQIISLDELYAKWDSPFNPTDPFMDQVYEIQNKFINQAKISYSAFDWANQNWSTKTLPPCQILILEGVGALAPKLNSQYDFRICLQTGVEAGRLGAESRDHLEGSVELAQFVLNTQEYLIKSSVAQRCEIQLFLP